MSYYIIVRGPLGSGKSTISLHLSKILKAEYVSFDKVLEDNGLDRVDDAFTQEDFIKANKIVLKEALNNLKEHKIVIFDGCFYFKEQIKHLVKNLPYKGYIFTLKTSLETCIRRDRTRKKVYGRQAAKEVYDLVSKFDDGIKINNNKKTEKEVVKEILSFLPKDESR